MALATWSAYGVSEIWIIGHSFIVRAARRAEDRPGGRNLGLYNVPVNWRGCRGLRWAQVLSEVVLLSRNVRGPVILVLHVGGNDLCFVHAGELIALMKEDLARFSVFFPHLLVVWSEIVPRVVWRGARDVGAIEGARMMVNARMSRFVRYRGGVVVRHRELEDENRSLLEDDGVHPNPIGLDILLLGLRDGVERALFLMGKGRSAM